MEVIFLHGPAAAGKYTIGSLVAEQLGYPLFHNHLTVDLVSTLFDFGTPEFVELRESIWLQAFQQAASAQRSFVFTFHPERTVRPGLIDALQATVEDHDGKMHFVALECAHTTVEQRLDNPSRKRFGKLTDGTLYRQILADGGFDFPPLPTPLITVDTEQLNAADAASAIVEAVRGS